MKMNGGLKVKRKELEDFNDDFSEFSLSSPARKIRRLDLPPIVEEEVDFPMGYEQSMTQSTVSGGVGKRPVIEELPFVPDNEEKAIVLFKPINTPLTYTVDPNLISTFRNEAFWGANLNAGGPRNKDQDVSDGETGEENACRAVIPWVPSQQLNLEPHALSSQTEMSESMDAEEPEVTMMEIEDTGVNVGQHASEYNVSRFNEGLQHQWQQQHCMIPQPPQNTTTPIVWYR